MLNYTISEAAAAVSESNRLSRKDVLDILGFAFGFLAATALIALVIL